VSSVLARWSGNAGTLRHERSGANKVYEFASAGERRFLRLTRDAHRDREQLEAELEFVRFVASRGVEAALPCPSASGTSVEDVRGSDGEPWHAVAFTAVPGRHFRYFSSDIERPLFRAWGEAMGALHAAAREFVPATSARRPAWDEQDTTRCDAASVPATETEGRREHARVAEWLRSLRPTPDSWGLIHGDFERTNFTRHGTAIHVFDFDDACYHWYVADIANALWAFRHAPAADRARFLTWFLDGYRERCPLEVDVRAELSWLVRLRTLTLFVHHHRVGSGAADDAWTARARASFATPFRW
jgi:Ser/Thr protein kinase RdoA (MazF antagonist)